MALSQILIPICPFERQLHVERRSVLLLLKVCLHWESLCVSAF